MGASLPKPLQELSSDELADAVAGIGSRYEPFKDDIVSYGVNGAVVASFETKEELAETLRDELGIASKLQRKRLVHEWEMALRPGKDSGKSSEKDSDTTALAELDGEKSADCHAENGRCPPTPLLKAKSSHTGPCRVILARGSGKKRKFNGRAAFLIDSGTPKRGSAWATVEIPPVAVEVDGNATPAPATTARIKWRSGAWKESDDPNESLGEADDGAASTDVRLDEEDIGLSDLSDDLLARVFRYLGAPDSSERDPPNNDTFDPVKANRSPTFIPDPFSIRQAARLSGDVSLISKRFRDMCRDDTTHAKMLGPIDADFTIALYDDTGVNIFDDIVWMTNRHVCLRSLKLKTREMNDTAVIVYILRHCNVVGLHVLEALVAQSCWENHRACHIRHYSLINTAWIRMKTKRSGGFMVEWDEIANTSQKMKAAELGIDLSGVAVTSLYQLHAIIATACTSLRCLKTNFEVSLDPSIANQVHEDLFAARTLEKLHLVFVDNGGGCYRRNMSTNALVLSLQRARSLKVLFLGSHDACGIRLEVRSPSLEHVNMTNAGKGTWATRIDCPLLKRLVCSGEGIYGNGIRPRKHDGELEGYEKIRGEYNIRETRFDGFLDFNGGVLFQRMIVHPSCVVDFKRHGDW